MNRNFFLKNDDIFYDILRNYFPVFSVLLLQIYEIKSTRMEIA